MSKALIPGSFDPITVGHLDIIKRTCRIFDSVTVLVSKNSDKRYMLTDEQRKLLILSAVKDLENVTVDVYDGLVAQYAYNNQIDAVVKGIRNNLDYNYEADMALANEKISKTMFNKSFETLLMPCKPQYTDVSSSLVRLMLGTGADISQMVPDKKLLLEILNK